MTEPMPTLFIDRVGTLIEEPPDHQVDSFEKLRFVPGVIPALLRLREAGFRFVMVTNQDGLGRLTFPEESFRGPQRLLLQILESQGIVFDDVLICPHRENDGCLCRKPGTALVDAYVTRRPIQPEASVVIGDRETDLQLAERLGIRGIRYLSSDPEGWRTIADELGRRRARRARVRRETRETRIEAGIDLDSEAPVAISTGIGFFDHMLEQIARHAGLSLELQCEGDLRVDEHHTVEDCALVLGQALREALGDKRGIGRYGFVLPMDEAQAGVVLDLSGRAYAKFDGHFDRERVGELPTELVPHFFRSLGDALGASIHIDVRGANTHHMVEACFKAVGRALRQAIRIEGVALPSSKGVL
jgi:imidazoleglycerol-phosphate dehydratase/histidinol-phosphatase